MAPGFLLILHRLPITGKNPDFFFRFEGGLGGKARIFVLKSFLSKQTENLRNGVSAFVPCGGGSDGGEARVG
ncbi:hypothetical protein V6N13_066867 [Hibiscus sabdariffa]